MPGGFGFSLGFDGDDGDDWSPSDIVGGLTAWYRADSVTLVGSKVDPWPDKSGNGRSFVQATDANRFTYTTNAAGRPVLRAAAAGPKMSVTFGATISQPGTVVIVCSPEPDPADATRTLVDGIAAGNRWAPAYTTGPALGYAAGTSAVYMHAGTGTPSINIAGADLDVTHAYRFEFNGASSKIFKDTNTVAGVTGDAGAHSLTGINLGSDNAGTASFRGDFEELIYIPKLLSAAEVSSLNAYLKSRYPTIS